MQRTSIQVSRDSEILSAKIISYSTTKERCLQIEGLAFLVMMIDHDNCLVKILQVTIWSSATNTVAIDIQDTELLTLVVVTVSFNSNYKLGSSLN